MLDTVIVLSVGIYFFFKKSLINTTCHCKAKALVCSALNGMPASHISPQGSRFFSEVREGFGRARGGRCQQGNFHRQRGAGAHMTSQRLCQHAQTCASSNQDPSREGEVK